MSLTSRADLPDEALVAACRAQDPEALETLLRRHTRALSAVLRRMVGDADVEDMLQETLVAAVKAFPSYRGDASVGRWLIAIAVRVAITHRRSAKRRPVVALEDLSREPEARGPAADAGLDGRRLLDRVFRHLDRVGDQQRIAFVLHVIEGYSIEEVARLTSASRVATKSRIFWARRRLHRSASRDPLLRSLLRREGEQ